jgi:hypothetical protein
MEAGRFVSPVVGIERRLFCKREATEGIFSAYLVLASSKVRV